MLKGVPDFEIVFLNGVRFFLFIPAERVLRTHKINACKDENSGNDFYQRVLIPVQQQGKDRSQCRLKVNIYAHYGG